MLWLLPLYLLHVACLGCQLLDGPLHQLHPPAHKPAHGQGRKHGCANSECGLQGLGG